MELDWYFEQFINTTNTIDYGIKYIGNEAQNTLFTLERIGDMPMPLDVVLTLKNGTKQLYYIPLSLSFGSKTEDFSGKIIQKDAWQWTYPQYRLKIPIQLHITRFFYHTLKISVGWVLKPPLIVVVLHGFIQGILPYYVAQLVQQNSTFSVAGHAISAVQFVKIGVGGYGFLLVVFYDAVIACVLALVRV